VNGSCITRLWKTTRLKETTIVASKPVVARYLRLSREAETSLVTDTAPGFGINIRKPFEALIWLGGDFFSFTSSPLFMPT